MLFIVLYFLLFSKQDTFIIINDNDNDKFFDKVQSAHLFM